MHSQTLYFLECSMNAESMCTFSISKQCQKAMPLVFIWYLWSKHIQAKSGIMSLQAVIQSKHLTTQKILNFITKHL